MNERMIDAYSQSHTWLQIAFIYCIWVKQGNQFFSVMLLGGIRQTTNHDTIDINLLS